MKKSDVQLGKPSILYKGTTAELEAISAVEGMQAYDTTLDKFVYYDGSNWAEVSGTDDDAIHDNVSGEIAAITEKTSLADNDLVLIEDSAASNAKKKSKNSTFLAKARSILFLNEITILGYTGSFAKTAMSDLIIWTSLDSPQIWKFVLGWNFSHPINKLTLIPAGGSLFLREHHAWL